MPKAVPLTPRVISLTKLAIEEAIKLNHEYAGAEHFLLAILAEKESLAYTALQATTDLDKLKAELLRLVPPHVTQDS